MVDDDGNPGQEQTGEGQPTRVVSLDEERTKRRKTKAQKSDLYLAIARAIDGRPGALPSFPRRFHIVEPEQGVRLVLEELDDGVVRYIKAEAVAAAILRYTVNDLANREAYKWDVRQARAAMEFWLSYIDPIPEPPAVLWAEEHGLTFSRLPWCYAPDFDGNATPLFNELFGRISNASALIEWIGSLFDPEADRQQYAWLYGAGGDGKGALARFLARVFGRAYRSVQPPAPAERHWTAGLVGARLVVFPDCNAYGFPASGLFKVLTGGDSVPVERKYEDAYSAQLTAKFMFLSNERPQLSSERADMRRALYCEVEAIKAEVDPAYEKRLWDEGGAFLSTCIHNYRTGYPHGGPIRIDTDELEAWVDVIEEDFSALVETHLVLGVDERCFQTQWVEWCKANFKDSRVKRQFMAYLERKHDVRMHKRERLTVRLKDGRFVKAYKGFRLVGPSEQRLLIVDP